MTELDKAIRERDEARAALAWQPIETAPKDGTPILVSGPGLNRGPFVAAWDADPEYPETWRGPGCRVAGLTHWQPLPTPPPRAQEGVTRPTSWDVITTDRSFIEGAQEWQGPKREVVRCPRCAKPLEHVTYPRGSMLNEDQWDAVRAGDWWCETCPSNGRGKAGAYFWNREIGAQEGQE